MILPGVQSPLHALVLHLALWPTVLGVMNNNNNESDDWIQKVRKLQVGQFMSVCNQVMMSNGHSSYLMSDFATDVGAFCTRYSTDKTKCPNSSFRSLQTNFQDAFFRHAAQHMGRPMISFPLRAVMQMGDTGYIVSDKSQTELDAMKNDLCVEMQTAFGDSVVMPEDAPTDPGTSPTPDSPSNRPTAAPRTPRPTNAALPIESGIDLKKSDSVGNEAVDNAGAPIPVYEEDSALSVGAIIGIAIAVALLLVCFFYMEARRRSLARQVRNLAASSASSRASKSNMYIDTRDASLSSEGIVLPRKSSKNSPSSSVAESLEELREAIDCADWDTIYRLASLLAEDEEACSLSSFNIPKSRSSRRHLSTEDQVRTTTLDELMEKADWTGLAVTAALYAGESGSEHTRPIDPPSAKKKTKKVKNFGDEEWKPVRLSPIATSPADIEEGHVPMDEMVRNLNNALNAGDWEQVGFYANKIKDERGSEAGSFASDIPDTQAMVLASGSSRIAANMSSDTTETDVSRKQTIEKLARAGKWKGVSIMANLYHMETKQTKSSVVKGTGTALPPRHSSKKSRTKELRHSDRVNENIVGFRQEDDTANNRMVPFSP